MISYKSLQLMNNYILGTGVGDLKSFRIYNKYLF